MGGTSATKDLPPLLMRWYELHILQLQRPGTVPPFDRQYRDTTSPPYAFASGKLDTTPDIEGMSLRQIHSRAMG